MLIRGTSVGKKCHCAFYLGLCQSASVKIKQTDGMRRQVAPWGFFCPFSGPKRLMCFCLAPDFSAVREEPGEGVVTPCSCQCSLGT